MNNNAPEAPAILVDRSYAENVDAFAFWWNEWGLGDSEMLPISACDRFLSSGPWNKREAIFGRTNPSAPLDEKRIARLTHTLSTHAPSCAAAWKMFNAKLSAPPKGPVLLTAGGCGSGKSTHLRGHLAPLVEEAEIIIDSPLARQDDAQEYISRALSSRRHVVIATVFRPLVKAIQAIADRFSQIGPWLPLEVLVRDHVMAIETTLMLGDRHKNDKQVRFVLTDNRGDHPKEMTLAGLKRVRYLGSGETAEQAVSRLIPVMKKRLSAG